MKRPIIESGIPIPEAHGRGSSAPMLHFLESMKPGQSFAAPVAEASSVRGLVHRAHQKKIGKFTIRVMGRVVRAWRVK